MKGVSYETQHTSNRGRVPCCIGVANGPHPRPPLLSSFVSPQACGAWETLARCTAASNACAQTCYDAALPIVMAVLRSGTKAGSNVQPEAIRHAVMCLAHMGRNRCVGNGEQRGGGYAMWGCVEGKSVAMPTRALPRGGIILVSRFRPHMSPTFPGPAWMPCLPPTRCCSSLQPSSRGIATKR